MAATDFNRLHITYSGDPTLAAAWVPFAKSKVLVLLRQQAAFGGSQNQVVNYRPAHGVRVLVRITGEDKFVHIEATSGCTDRQGFLLSRTGSAYSALYNDGLVENINPIDGSPRPVPDLAVRTKGYKVPQQLRREQLARLSASKFSGMMRLVVGCYHAAGKEAPFSYSHTVTHGIVKKTSVMNGVTTNHFWVVEISTLGVYAAPVTYSGDCCDSWNVSAYMATAAQIALNPSLATLSLHSGFVIGRAHITQLVTQTDMGTVYADGDPWFDGCGWAFSASGAEAQTVVQDFFVSPDTHFKCSRWKITFAMDVNLNLGATVVGIERIKPCTFIRGCPVWTPIFAGQWSGTFGATAPAIALYPVQDAPIHVFYDGETEIVTRWTLTSAALAETFIPQTAFFVAGAPGAIPSCALPNPFTFTEPEHGHGREQVFAHTNTNAGFTNPYFTYTGDIFSRGARIESYTYSDFGDPVITENANAYTLDPSCYFFDEDGNLVTHCTSTFQTVVSGGILATSINFQGTEVSSHAAAVVLFAEEREAVLSVMSDGFSQSGTADTGAGTLYYTHTSVTKIDSGPCQWITLDYEQAGIVGSVGGTQGPYSTRTADGSATLVLGSGAFTATLPMTGAPNYDIDNANLSTFLSWQPITKTTAESNVQAIHGNLYYPEVDLVPVLQRNNYFYVLDAGGIIAGGFAQPGDACGFVGKA